MNEQAPLLRNGNEVQDSAFNETRESHPPESRRCNGSLVLKIVVILGLTAVVMLILWFHILGDYDITTHNSITNTSENPIPLPSTYDYIIVGSGPAGSLIAKKLAVENRGHRVLLIEAGDATQRDIGGHVFYRNSNLTRFDVPLEWSTTSKMNGFQWQDVGNALACKGLGGCGTHNAMLYVRALQKDIEKWNHPKVWSWEKVLQMYMNVEKFEAHTENKTASYLFHGSSGEIETSSSDWIDPVAYDFLEACKSKGIPMTADFNDPRDDASGRHGAGFYHFNIRNGIRDSVARAFLASEFTTEGKKLKNLEIRINSTVEKLIVENKAVRGIVVRDGAGNDAVVNITNEGEVILSAGSINTPRLLISSGIGHQDELRELGIPLVHHLPQVGKNLQDHPALAFVFDSKTLPTTNGSSNHKKMTDWWSDYLKDKGGKYASSGISVGAFIIPPGSTEPEVQLTLFSKAIREPHVEKDQVGASVLGHTQILLTVALLTPEAKNRLMVQKKADILPETQVCFSSLNVSIQSEVPEQFREHLTESDAKKLLWAVKFVNELVEHNALKPSMGDQLAPAKDLFTNDDELLSWIRKSVFKNSHWVGSSKMITLKDTTGSEVENAADGVVDERLRLIGIENLRVADASVIPFIPNGNVHSTVVMVASRAVELIVEDRNVGRN